MKGMFQGKILIQRKQRHASRKLQLIEARYIVLRFHCLVM